MNKCECGHDRDYHHADRKGRLRCRASEFGVVDCECRDYSPPPGSSDTPGSVPISECICYPGMCPMGCEPACPYCFQRLPGSLDERDTRQEAQSGGTVPVPSGTEVRHCAICKDTAGPFHHVKGIYGEGWLCDDFLACKERDQRIAGWFEHVMDDRDG